MRTEGSYRVIYDPGNDTINITNLFEAIEVAVASTAEQSGRNNLIITLNPVQIQFNNQNLKKKINYQTINRLNLFINKLFDLGSIELHVIYSSASSRAGY